MLKQVLKIFLFTFIVSIQFVCPNLSGTPPSSTQQKSKTITVGVTAGLHEEVMEFVKTLAAQQGLNIKIVPFNDYILPNAALDQGDLDLNSYQHEPFLEDQIKSRHYKILSIGKSLLQPIGLYSKKIKNIKDLKDKAHIAIPNDPTNGGRALLLLEKAGLITLKAGSDHKVSILDIKNNPKKLKIIEIEAPQLPRALEDVDAAIINTEFALLSGLNPQKDAIFIEDQNSPYANVFAVRIQDKDNQDLLKFIKIYQSPQTEEFVKNRFGNSVIPAWK